MLKASLRRLPGQIWKPLRGCRLSLLSRGSRKFSSTNVSLAFEHLTSRSLVRVSGEDASEYLQGLVTNDMRHLQEDANSPKDSAIKSMYCMFLDARGRVILDGIIYKTFGDSKSGDKEVVFLIECDSEIESTLLKHLKMYKLRKKVDISKISNELDVWVEFVPDAKVLNSGAVENYNFTTKLSNKIVCRDPRLSCLGVRHLCPKSESPISDGKEQKILHSGHYTMLRYSLGVGEGVIDHPPGACTPLEANGDYLHGVSFHKGCYVGQELTARTHHTGVIRKRLMPLFFQTDTKIEVSLKPDTPVIDGTTGKGVGKVRGITKCDGITVGLGLLRVVEVLKSSHLKVCDSDAKTLRPFWWPEEAPRDVKSATKT